MIGSPLQAIKFALMLNNGACENFLNRWLDGNDLSTWGAQTEHVPDTSTNAAKRTTFAEFCASHPDEPERADGRKAHYGSGLQPWDIIKALGWGPQFAAGNVLKYMRRDKDAEHSKKSAAVYYRWLRELALMDAGKISTPRNVCAAMGLNTIRELWSELSDEEKLALSIDKEEDDL